MSAAEPQVNIDADPGRVRHPREIRIYQHSRIFYWWPVWVTGFIMALITYLGGSERMLGEGEDATAVYMSGSKNLGVVFTVIFTLVFLLTSVSLRGMASALLIAGVLVLTLTFALLDWWGPILESLGNLAIFMNLGFYVFFSTTLFIIWAISFFVVDRMKSWLFRPGQMIVQSVWGGAERTYDTHGMTVYKMRDDLFRHWLLGLGSGDLHIATSGAEKATYTVENTLFIGWRLEQIQYLVAMKPDELSDMPEVAAGQ